MEELINNVDAIILSFVQGSFGNFTGTVQALWHLMFIVFVAFYGYKIMISGRFSASDLLIHCVKIIIILGLATKWDMFFLFIFNMVTDLPSDIAGQMMLAASSSFSSAGQVGSEASANTALSQFFDRGMAVSANVLQGAGWTDFGQYFYAFAIWIGTIGVTGYAAMLIILAKLAVAVLLGLGPIFILLLIFTNTKALFEGWLRTLLNYALVPVFVYTLLAILLTLAEGPLSYLEKSSNIYDELITAIGPFLLISVISILLLAQILNIAASVTGGVSLSTMGFGRLISRDVATTPTLKVTTGISKWGWRKTAPARSNAVAKVKAGMNGSIKAGRHALGQALKTSREVR